MEYTMPSGSNYCTTLQLSPQGPPPLGLAQTAWSRVIQGPTPARKWTMPAKILLRPYDRQEMHRQPARQMGVKERDLQRYPKQDSTMEACRQD